jgi:REP element-mobilizing transposase RayT
MYATRSTLSPRAQRIENVYSRIRVFMPQLSHLRRKVQHTAAWIGRYVLMPDHCHLFVACDHERISLSAWAKSFKNALSAELRRIGIESPHWQKGFFDHLLRSEESAAEKWEYVR